MPHRDEVIYRKAETIKRCVARAREEFLASDHFETDFTRQDAALLNIERACQAAIGLANRVISKQGLTMPATMRESFSTLGKANVIAPDLAQALEKMVGFRNTAVHAYQVLDMAIVKVVITDRLDDLLRLADALVDY
jgi:uncharacterized protein YutE (UPF0331/DUF86 family)